MKQTWASRLLVGLLGLGLLLFFVAVMAISGRVALAQDAGTTSTFGAFLASSTDEQVGLAGAGAGAGAGARAGAASVLPDDLRFRLRLVHSVRFPLTEQRCYFQFFVDADGSSPLEGASLALELVEDSRVVGLNRVEIADLSGQGLSRRVREFAFDGPCSLDGLRLISATGAFQPAGVNYTAPVVTAAAAPPPHALSRHRLKPPPGAGSCPLPAPHCRSRLSGPAFLPCLLARPSCPAPDCALSRRVDMAKAVVLPERMRQAVTSAIARTKDEGRRHVRRVVSDGI